MFLFMNNIVMSAGGAGLCRLPGGGDWYLCSGG